MWLAGIEDKVTHATPLARAVRHIVHKAKVGPLARAGSAG